MTNNTQYTQKYSNKRQAKKITFDLYLDDEMELEIYNLLDEQRANKQLKQFIISAILAYDKQA